MQVLNGGKFLAIGDEEGYISIINTATQLPTYTNDEGASAVKPAAQWEAHKNAIFDVAWARVRASSCHSVLPLCSSPGRPSNPSAACFHDAQCIHHWQHTTTASLHAAQVHLEHCLVHHPTHPNPAHVHALHPPTWRRMTPSCSLLPAIRPSAASTR